jgi:hypothetical protein
MHKLCQKFVIPPDFSKNDRFSVSTAKFPIRYKKVGGKNIIACSILNYLISKMQGL